MADQHIPIGFGRVTMGYTRPGDAEPMLNVFGVATALSGFSVATAVLNAWTSALKGDQASNIFLEFVRFEQGSLTGAPPYLVFQDDFHEAGGASAYGQPPPNVAVLVKKVTAAAGRQGRGRLYWPVIGDDFTNNVGILDSAVLADLQSAFTTFLGDLAGEDVAMYLLHGAGQPITDPTEVVQLLVDSKAATQRRRLRS